LYRTTVNNLNAYIAEFGITAFKNQAYHYSKAHTYSCILDSCNLGSNTCHSKYEFLAAFGAEICLNNLNTIAQYNDHWLFGILGYDLKNSFEQLSSSNPATIHTPDILFFVPETIIAIDKQHHASILKGHLPKAFWDKPKASPAHNISAAINPLSKVNYLNQIQEIQYLIKQGEVYELNFCVNHLHTYTSFSPIDFQLKLNQHSPVPMAAYLKAGHLHLCGASMERFLSREKNTLISQPIKGTIRRGKTAYEDEILKKQLESSEKDRAENVMIVDLVRNDLNRICNTGTVHVAELFGIYSYPQVHQMISTVQGTQKPESTLSDVLQSTFPMGSMTGAPKIAAMNYIEELESFKRGWYSGSLGYIDPNGNFDFNVVIRSLLCDTHDQKISYSAGGAITIDSVAENEWEEIQLKTKAIHEILTELQP